MKLRVINLSQEFTHILLLPLSDLHIGDPQCNMDDFLSCRKWIEETPNAFVILNGDMMNTAIKSSVSDVYAEAMSPNEQIKLAVKLLSPIKDRILAVTSGNHEHRIYKETGVDVVDVMAQQLGVWYAGEEALFKIRFGCKKKNGKPIVYVIYATHGWGSGRTKGSKVNNLQDLSKIALADIYIAAHTHFMTAHHDIYLVPDQHNNNVIEMTRTFVSSGAFLNRGGYAVRKGYPPEYRGSPVLRLEGTAGKNVRVWL